MLEQLTLRQKVAQMVLCGFEGTEPSIDILHLIKEYGIGGVIYFSRNVRNVKQVADLSDRLQTAARDAGIPPLWISIDQEGGMVARITDGVALMPGQMAIAAGGDQEAAYTAGSICGRELKALGINLNFAPDLDVNNNSANPVIGVRSFGEDPDIVADYGIRMLKGLQDAGVVATAKHFPGHGDTHVDSHLDLPTVTHSREQMDKVELKPFRAAIEAGVDAVMSAHIYFPELEKERLPVTLSHKVLTGLLREELGFEGVIMTDCMEMNAISEHYGTVEAAVMAVEAGADLILISHRHFRQTGAIEAITAAVESGQIPEERIDRSVKRLLDLKRKRGLNWGFATDPSVVGVREHMEAARRISEASVTLVRDERGYLPLAPLLTLAVSLETGVVSMVDESYESPLSLGKALAKEGVNVVEYEAPLQELEQHKERILAMAAHAEQIVIGTYNAAFFKEQADLVRLLHATGKPLIVVATRNPYDLTVFPDISAYVAVYESRPMALQSCAKALTGRIPFGGRLPVTLGGLYPAGWGGGGR